MPRKQWSLLIIAVTLLVVGAIAVAQRNQPSQSGQVTSQPNKAGTETTKPTTSSSPTAKLAVPTQAATKPQKPAPTTTATPAGTSSHPIRAMFYYPWFPQTWGLESGTAFTNFHPTAGYYSSDDRSIVDQHIKAMRYARMDVAVSSWWGQNQQNEQSRLPMQLTAAEGTGLTWALYYEKEGFGDPSVSEIRSDLAYINQRYVSSSTFAQINKKPVIFVYGDDKDDCGMAARWGQANQALGNQFHIILKVFNGFRGCAQQPGGWHQYSPAVATDTNAGLYYAIGAGFWKKGESPVLNRDPKRWVANVKSMVASKAPLQLVATFNEWGEGTALESATEWSSPSGYGTYLDALHDNIPAN